MARKVKSDDTINWVADADYTAGTLIEHASGKVGVIVNDVLSGETCTLELNVTVEIDNSGVIFADGATVGYDQSADNAVVAAGGDFDCGKAVQAATATQKVLVMLNA